MEKVKELSMFGRGNLQVFIEENKARLFWKKCELTKGLALHSAFQIDGNWYDSTCASWRVLEISSEKLYVSVEYRDIPLAQSWMLTFSQDNELLWDVEMRIKQSLKIKKRKIGIFISDKYTRWFYSSKEGQFPPGFNWEDICLARIDSRGFGVKPLEGYPGILLEVETPGLPILQNSSGEFSARVLQFELPIGPENDDYAPGYYTWSKARIKLLEDEAVINEYMRESGKRFLADNSLSNDAIKVFFEKRLARLYWKEMELTKHFGIHTIFSLNNTWYGSSYADWKITKIGQDKARITIDYKDIPVVHEWTLTFAQDNELVWDVDIRIKKPVQITHKKMGLFVTDKYSKWFSCEEEGVFPEIFSWQNIFLNHTDSKGIGVRPAEAVPGVLFEIDADGVALLQNTDDKFSARTLQFELEDEPLGGYYEPGCYKWASARIKLIEDELAMKEYFNKQRKILMAAKSFSKGKLRLYFDEGQAKLYWNDLELTKGFGLHIALDAGKNWYDSFHAQWRVKKTGQEKLYINVRYRDIPVTQSWVLAITGENEIDWVVDIQVKEPLRILQKKVSLFLSDKYTHWFNSAEEGKFPKGFNWENIILTHKDSRGFGVKPCGEYPGIFFESNMKGSPLLQNTSEDLRGRALRFELEQDKQGCLCEPGNSYRLFSGRIRLIEDERIISEYIENSKPLPIDNETCYLFADSEELHNKIADSASDFKEKLAKIKQSLEQGKKINIKIGVSRFNFFRIKEIAEFCLGLLGKTMDFGKVPLNLFPGQRLYLNFIDYLEKIKTIIHSTEIKLVLVDKELFDILLTISSQANLYNEKKLIRLLGVITEHAFIGPQIVVVDPHHRCNVNCLHCWIHTPGIVHTQEFLARKFDFDLYKKMIDDFAELKVDSILFQGDGEPLLYDKFFDMVNYARGKNIEAIFFTNGLLLDKKIAEDVVALGVSQIFCSLPAGTAKTYSLVTHRDDPNAFQKVLDNLKYLSVVKSKENKINPRLIMTHVIHSLNYKEILEMAKNDFEIGADVIRFYLIRLDDNIKFLQLKPEEVEYIRGSMREVKSFLKDKRVELLDTTDFQLSNIQNDSGAWSKGVFLREGCLLGWFFCLVPALGDISLCCHLRTVGYLKEKSFKEIWTSKEYARYRVQAKYLKDNKDVTFLNGVKLYDEHCEHCDTHQVIRDIQEDLKNYNLDRFVFKQAILRKG